MNSTGVSSAGDRPVAADRPRIFIIAGPTGVGKTGAAVLVAEELGAEIISADSRQIYRGLEIGTAAPAAPLLARIPHHLVAGRDPRESWSAGEFAREAADLAAEIVSRARHPLLVGGSGFYLQALTNGIFAEPDVDPEQRAAVRKRLRDRCAREGPEVLHAELGRVDPAWAAAIAPTDSQRIVRGLEVWETHGRPLSDLQSHQADGPPLEAEFRSVLLVRDRADLYARIDRRVQEQLDRGWLDEARHLRQEGIPPDAPGLSGLGYDILFAHLDSELTLEEARERIRQEHRHYAKRQLTWFRRFEAIRIPLTPEDGPSETAGKILTAWTPPGSS